MNFTEKRKTIIRRQSVARLLSYLFNPLILPTLTMALVINDSPDFASSAPAAKAWLLATLAFGTGLFPLAGLFILYYFGFVRGAEIPNRHDRAIPFLLITVTYMVTDYVFVEHLDYGLTVLLLLSGAAFSVALVTLVTLFYKTSAHAAAAGAMAGCILGVSRFHDLNLMLPFVFALLVSGLVMSARMQLRMHTLAESLSGWLIGFAICFGLFYRMGSSAWY